MGLNRYRLGELIEQRREKYAGNSILPVRGVSRDGFIDAKQPGADKSIYNVFYKFDFVFNPARMEINSIALNVEYDKAICSSLYEVFFISRKDVILPEYLNLFIKRDEFARQCEFIGWGSAREYCRVSNIADIIISLPPLFIQQKYVDIYNAMLANQRCYESGLEDLKLTVDATIDQYKHTSPRIALRDLLIDVDVRNTNEIATSVYGVTMSKKFVPSVANLDGVNLSRYKLVSPNQMACNFMHVGRDESLPIAINNTEETIAVSPAYFVFDTKSDKCLAEYIMMWLSREESGRYCWYISDTSVRGGFSLECFYDIEIPVPDIQVQQYIANVYIVYQLRREINEQLKKQIRDICPILIKGSVEEA